MIDAPQDGGGCCGYVRRHYAVFIPAVHVVLRLLPILDLITDLLTLGQYVDRHSERTFSVDEEKLGKLGMLGYALILGSILLLNWRCTTIFAALTPRPSFKAIVILCAPTRATRCVCAR